MVDTLALGASGVKPVEVRVLSRPPYSAGYVSLRTCLPAGRASGVKPVEVRVLSRAPNKMIILLDSHFILT